MMTRFQTFAPGADPAFAIRGDPIQKFSYQILGNYSKQASFFAASKMGYFLEVQRSTAQFLIVKKTEFI